MAIRRAKGHWALGNEEVTVSGMKASFVDPAQVRRYAGHGPPAFAPGHAGLLQRTGVLLAERVRV